MLLCIALQPLIDMLVFNTVCRNVSTEADCNKTPTVTLNLNTYVYILNNLHLIPTNLPATRTNNVNLYK